MFRHVETLLRNIQAHSNIFSLTLASRVTYSQPCHIPSPGILWTGSIFKTLWTFDQASSETCHSENSLFRHYQTIFSIFGIFCNPRICRNPEHLESIHDHPRPPRPAINFPPSPTTTPKQLLFHCYHPQPPTTNHY